MSLPVLEEVEPLQFKATVQLAGGATQAKHAAARVAFRELEASLMAKAKTRMAQKDCDIV